MTMTTAIVAIKGPIQRIQHAGHANTIQQHCWTRYLDPFEHSVE